MDSGSEFVSDTGASVKSEQTEDPHDHLIVDRREEQTEEDDHIEQDCLGVPRTLSWVEEVNASTHNEPDETCRPIDSWCGDEQDRRYVLEACDETLRHRDTARDGDGNAAEPREDRNQRRRERSGQSDLQNVSVVMARRGTTEVVDDELVAPE